MKKHSPEELHMIHHEVKEIEESLHDRALDTFVIEHHREPTASELRHLELSWIHEIDRYLESTGLVYKKAANILAKHLPTILTKSEMTKMKANLDEAERIYKEEDVKLTTTPTIHDAALQHLLGLSDETLYHWDRVVNSLYHDNAIEDAAAILFLMTTLNPFIPSWWLSLGICLRKLNKPLEALRSFAMNTLLEEAPLLGRANAIECYLELKETDHAKSEFTEFCQLLENNPAEKDKWQTTVDTWKTQLS